MKTLFMETTTIDAAKTAAEITSLLVQAGAHQLMMEYDDNKEISGLRFALKMKDRSFVCVLPARVDPIFKIINGRRKSSYDRTQKAVDDRFQARRVAWRQLLRWVQAQLAMIDAGMVQSAEVFLPYIEVEPGVTMFERIINDPSRMISAGTPQPERQEESHVDAEFVS